MSDEMNKEKLEQVEPEKTTEEVVKPEEQEVEAPVEEEVKSDETVDEVKPEEVPEERKTDIEPVEESKGEEPEKETNDGDNDNPTEETEPKVEEEPVEEKPEVVEEEVDIDAIKAELEELKAEKEEAADIEALNKENVRVAREYDELCGHISAALEKRMTELGIPLDKSIEEIEKEDKAKAEIAKSLITEANTLIERAQHDATEFLNNKSMDLVFKKADRLLKKFDVTEEEADVVAETFLDIIAQSGIRDLKEDLMAKLELAVARAKMVCKGTIKAAEVIKEAAEVVKDKVEEVHDKIEKVEEIVKPKEEKTEEKKNEDVKEPELKPEEKAPEVTEEKPDLSEFEEGAGVKSGPVSERVTVDNALQKMFSLPFKEQAAFYKEHYQVIEEAQKRNRRDI